MNRLTLSLAIATTIVLMASSKFVEASSHREAPLITKTPKVDGTDFYMFRSYERGHEGTVTFIANYQPLEDPYGGPNYFLLDPNAIYSIKIDNNGDAIPDITYDFKITNTYKNLTIPVNGTDVAVPFSNIGPFGDLASAGSGPRNVVESYTLSETRGNGAPRLVTNLNTGGTTFLKPFDNIGNKSIPNYDAYASLHISKIILPGCPSPGRVFVGQRNDGFAVNLGKVFDLINLNPVGDPAGEKSTISDKNVTTFAMEVPIACLTKDSPDHRRMDHRKPSS